MNARNNSNRDSSLTNNKFYSSSTPIFSRSCTSESASVVCTLTQTFSTFYSTSSNSSSSSLCSLSSSCSSFSNSRPIFNTYKEDYCNVIPPYLIEASKLKKKTKKKEDESKDMNRQGYSRLNNNFEDEDTEVQKEDNGPEKNQWSKMIWEKLTKKEKNKKKEEETTKLSNPTNPISNLVISDEVRANSRKDIDDKDYTIYKVMWNCKTCNLLNKALHRSCEKCHMPRAAGTAVWI